MLAFLVNTEAKLKQWTKKLAREQDVEAVITDYNVSFSGAGLLMSPFRNQVCLFCFLLMAGLCEEERIDEAL